MRSLSRIRSIASGLVGVVLAFLGSGCGEPPLVPVEGLVTFEGKPLSTGQVVFFPDDGRSVPSNRVPQGKIDESGRYTILTSGKPGAPAGKYRVVVICQTQTRPASMPANPLNVYPLIPQIYFGESTTKLRLEVVATSVAGGYDLKLVR
jgi:hypothetical protein